jgi:membrane-associated phospholipid phosphatase
MPTMQHGLPEPLAAKLGPLGRYELRATLFGLAVVLVGIPFGLLLEQVTTHGPLTKIDESAARAFNGFVYGKGALITTLELISDIGKPIFLLFSIGIPAVWIFLHGGRKLALFLAVTCIGGGIVDSLVKIVVARPRPTVDQPILSPFGKSFPSGHSMQAVVCYGALLLAFLPILSKRARVIAVGAWIFTLLAIGVSRLALGVHYISDVLGGWVLGAAWLAASVAAWEIWRDDRGKRPTHPTEEGVEPEEAKDLTHA